MSHETATEQKKALLNAFDDVLKKQAADREIERLAEEERRRLRNCTKPLILVCTAIILFIGAYLWVERPEWVFPPAAAPESMAVKEASLRIGLANVAQHVERYRQRNGRLPKTLTEAGAHGEWISYEVTGTSSYRLVGSNGPLRLALGSSDPLPGFLGNSFEVISRRSR